MTATPPINPNDLDDGDGRIVGYVVVVCLALCVLIAARVFGQTQPTTTPTTPAGYALAGYALAGGENVTIDFGTKTVDVAYGAGTKYLYRTNATGRVEFSNRAFGGDPIVGVRKAGYWRPTLAEVPVIVPATAPVPATKPVARNTIDLAITDGNGTPATNKPYFDAFGFRGVREWIGINWTTGRANGTGGIARCNAYAAAGYTVVATVTPDELGERKGRPMCPDFGVAAQDLLKLDPRVIIQLGNELNMPNYGIGGSFAAGYRTFALPLAKPLKAAGRVLAGPSIVWQTPAYILAQATPLVAETPPGTWTYWDGHDYTLDPVNFEQVLVAHETVARLFGARLMISEWGGFYGTGPTKGDPLAPVLSRHRDALGRHADIAAFFVAARVPKFGDDYAWLWNAADGTRSATGNAWIASSRPALSLATPRVYDSMLKRDREGWIYPGTTPLMTQTDVLDDVVSWWTAGKYAPQADRRPFSEDAARREAARVTPYAFRTIDLEWWPWNGSDAEVRSAVADASRLLAIFRAAGHPVGVYGALGDYVRAARYHYALEHASDPWWAKNTKPGSEYFEEFKQLQAENDRKAGVFDACDYVVVSCYLYYDRAAAGSTLADDLAWDTAYLHGNLAEAFRIAKGRPVFAYLMGHLHESSVSNAFIRDAKGDPIDLNIAALRIPPERWTNAVNVIRASGASLVFWENWFYTPRRAQMFEECVLAYGGIGTGCATRPAVAE